jgi:hypothetical protein
MLRRHCPPALRVPRCAVHAPAVLPVHTRAPHSRTRPRRAPHPRPPPPPRVPRWQAGAVLSAPPATASVPSGRRTYRPHRTCRTESPHLPHRRVASRWRAPRASRREVRALASPRLPSHACRAPAVPARRAAVLPARTCDQVRALASPHRRVAITTPHHAAPCGARRARRARRAVRRPPRVPRACRAPAVAARRAAVLPACTRDQVRALASPRRAYHAVPRVRRTRA